MKTEIRISLSVVIMKRWRDMMYIVSVEIRKVNSSSNYYY